MAILIKALNFGTITGSGTATMYTVPAGKSAIVNNVRLVNGGTSPSPSLNFYVRASGGASTSRRIHTRDFTIPANERLVFPDVITLGQGDLLQLELASSTTGIGFMINGVERD